MTMRGGGAEVACGRGASERRSLACSQASQCGLVVRPAKGFGSRWRLGSGGVGSRVVGHAVAGSLGHAQWSMTHSHTKATSTNWRSEEHTSELQSLAYLVCRLLLEK